MNKPPIYLSIPSCGADGERAGAREQREGEGYMCILYMFIRFICVDVNRCTYNCMIYVCIYIYIYIYTHM